MSLNLKSVYEILKIKADESFLNSISRRAVCFVKFSGRGVFPHLYPCITRCTRLMLGFWCRLIFAIFHFFQRYNFSLSSFVFLIRSFSSSLFLGFVLSKSFCGNLMFLVCSLVCFNLIIRLLFLSSF